VTFLANEHKEMEREKKKEKYKDKKKRGSMTRTWGLLLMMVFFPSPHNLTFSKHKCPIRFQIFKEC
jgi:hypothetical protein